MEQKASSYFSEMKNSIWVVYFSMFLLTSPSIFASNNNYPIGSRSSAMGNASSTFVNVFSNFHNQAGLAGIAHFGVGIAYKNNFLLSETGLKSAALAIPIKSIGVIGINVSSFGFDQYAENKYGLAFAKKFGDIISMGLQLDYMQTRFTEPYGSEGVLFAQFGIRGKLTENLVLGVHVYNPTRTSLNKTLNDRVPTILKSGISYQFNDKLITVFEIEKDLEAKMNVKAGTEYSVHEKFDVRFGINSFQRKVSFGTGINLDDWEIDIASEYHQALGFIPNMTIRWQLNRND